MSKKIFSLLFFVISFYVISIQSLSAQIPLSQAEITDGLKNALNYGIETAVKSTSQTDGFWKNSLIKLPFPEDAIKVRETALKFGLQKQVDEFELTLNKAAEEASKEALSIFLQSIKSLSIVDGMKLLNGEQNAATNFLKNSTTSELTTAFTPIVKNAISKVKLTNYWEPLTSKYNKVNKFTGGKPVTTDLNKYVTERAISGLFKLIELEEIKIRNNPTLQLTSTTKEISSSISKVFGSIKKP
jgi:hypothetical protein